MFVASRRPALVGYNSVAASVFLMGNGLLASTCSEPTLMMIVWYKWVMVESGKVFFACECRSVGVLACMASSAPYTFLSS